MKKFILQIVVFGIILLGSAFIADSVISRNLRRPTTSRLFSTWNNIYSSNIQADVLIIGSSRAYAQYSPQILDSILAIESWNFGMSGSMINRQIIIYDTYRRFNPKPKCIIQNIDVFTIDQTIGFGSEIFLPYFYDDTLITAISEYEKIDIFQKKLPLLRYFGHYNVINEGLCIPQLGQENLLKGYIGRDRKWDGSELKKQDKLFYSQDSAMLVKFDQYLAKAYSEDIKVIFVYAPLYIGATEKIQNIEGMYAMYDSIARKYNIPILDYNYDPISYDTTYFYNAMHLNKKGAELFSIKLAHAIDSLGILTNSKNNKQLP